MDLGLYCVYYRPDEQATTLAGGPGPTEMLVPLDQLTQARLRALDLPTRIHSLHCFSENMKGVTTKEVAILHQGTVIVVPTVDNLLRNPLELYRGQGWPGLTLQGDDYFALSRVAQALGGLPVPPEQTRHLRHSF